MDKFSEMSHTDRIAYLASKVALAKSYDSPVLTVPIPDLEILLAELEAKTKHIADMENVVAAAKCDDELWDAMAHRLKTLEDKLKEYEHG